ncbi:MAG: DUF4097 domain-containing protein [Clostridiales bacterium]|nr:DUF4097 domain-containing protein [Clostridiales bacterium]
MMRTSAITRIIIWSVVAALLIGVLLCGIFNWSFMGLRFQIPSSFGFGSFSYGYENAESYTIGGGEVSPELVQELDIHWVAGGEVKVIPYDGEKITFSETSYGELKEDEQMRYLVRDGKLIIQYMGKTRLFGFFTGVNTSKTLEVKVPSGKQFKKMDVESVSAPVRIEEMTAEKLEISSTSGDISALGCTAQSLRAENVSGRIDMSSRIREIRANTVSGDVSLQSELTPENIKVDTVSGSVRMALPEKDGFSVNYDTVSGHMNCEFPTTGDRDEFDYLNGGPEYKIDTVSGSVSIVKN